MSKIRTIAMINTFVVYPIFMVVYFRHDIKQFCKLWKMGWDQALEDEGVDSLKGLFFKGCHEAMAEEGYTSFRDMWNQVRNS